MREIGLLRASKQADPSVTDCHIVFYTSLGIFPEVRIIIFIYTEDRARMELRFVEILEDQAIQDELEVLWGDRLSSLTPKQRKMVAEILRQTNKYSKVQPSFSASRKVATSQVYFSNCACY